MITKYDQYIKESLSTKSDIKNWLDSMNIKKYTINDDLTVDVNGYVNISNEGLSEIPVKFNKVNGNFNCSYNNLTSLKGCPTTIDGNFFCFDNILTTLKGCPTTINGNFNFSDINLIDINDLNSKILIKNINNIAVTRDVYNRYFEYWIDKDFNIFEVLKDKVSNNIKQKYIHLFQANKFDLL